MSKPWAFRGYSADTPFNTAPDKFNKNAFEKNGKVPELSQGVKETLIEGGFYTRPYIIPPTRLAFEVLLFP